MMKEIARIDDDKENGRWFKISESELREFLANDYRLHAVEHEIPWKLLEGIYNDYGGIKNFWNWSGEDLEEFEEIL